MSDGDTGGQVSEGQALIGGDSGDDSGDDGDASSIDRLTERMDKFLGAIEADDEGDDDAWFDYLDDDDDDGAVAEADEDFDEDDEDDLSDEERDARELLQGLIDDRLREQIEPIVQTQREERRMQQLEALEETYPELQTREGAAPLLQNAERLAAHLGEPGLAYEAPFLETVYFRMKAEGQISAEDEAADEAGGSETPIERGGSAANSGAGDVDLAEEIVKAGKGRSFLIGG